MASLWTPDDGLLDLIRDRKVVNAVLRDIAGKHTANANVAEKIKTQKSIIRDHLTGSNNRRKVEGWVPKWLRFPATSYTARPFATLATWKDVQRHVKGLPAPQDRKSVVSGKSVSVRVDLGGRRIIKNKNTKHKKMA